MDSGVRCDKYCVRPTRNVNGGTPLGQSQYFTSATNSSSHLRRVVGCLWRPPSHYHQWLWCNGLADLAVCDDLKSAKRIRAQPANDSSIIQPRRRC